MINIIFIHGIYTKYLQLSNYSGILFNNIIKEYKRLDNIRNNEELTIFNQKEIYWTSAVNDLINRYINLEYNLNDKKGKWDWLTKEIDPLALQVMFYIKDKGDKKQGKNLILKIIHQKIEEYLKETKELVIIAHSLGSVIAFDYLFGFGKYKLSSKANVGAFITIGSPLALFISAMGHSDSKKRLPKNIKNWYDIFDPDDAVAKRSKLYFKNIKIKEIIVNTGWDPLKTHINYWYSRETAFEIAKILKKIKNNHFKG